MKTKRICCCEFDEQLLYKYNSVPIVTIVQCVSNNRRNSRLKEKAKSNEEIVLDIQSKSSEAEKPQSEYYLSLHHLTTAKP